VYISRTKHDYNIVNVKLYEVVLMLVARKFFETYKAMALMFELMTFTYLIVKELKHI
jgi:hypothetical protein